MEAYDLDYIRSQIIGVTIPPVARERIFQFIEKLGADGEEVQKRIEGDRAPLHILIP